MGGALFKDPWRTLPESKEALDFLKSYEPKNKQAKHVRILFYGPVGAGKSSFINSVDNIFKSRVTTRALTDAISGDSFTKKYKTLKIQKGKEGFYPFVFNDIMGIEGTKGVHVSDVKLALMGHVKEGYRFDPDRYLTDNDPGYNSHPSVDDRVHVLVPVVPVASVSLLSDDVVKKMREIREAASELDIPQLAILTKPDDACPKVKDNIKNIYKSGHLKLQVDKFSVLSGLPVNCIYVVKNYSSEIKIHDEMNAYILTALKQMILFGEDFLNDLPNEPDPQQTSKD